MDIGTGHPQEVQYQCGGCGSIQPLKPADPVRCRHCSYRILYKVRTTKLTQFDAR